MKHLGDITKINGHDVPIVDIVTGGSPCQDLSVAGKRAGLAGERSGLFMEQIRLIKEIREHDRANHGADVDIRLLRPRFMVWENVPGAFSSNNGEDFRAVLEETAKVAQGDACIPRLEKWPSSGCIMGNGWSIAWRVHDAQFWGVPQRRKRIALVADFGGERAPEILFERKGLSGDIETSGTEGQGVARSVEVGAGSTDVYCLQENGIDRADTAGCNGKGWREDVCYTLNTIDRPAVYDARGNGDGKTVCTLTGDHQNRVTDYTALCIGNGQANQSVSDKAGALNTMHDQQSVLCFQNTGQGWWNESDVGATIRTPCGGDSLKANLVAAVDCRNGKENESINGTLQAKSTGGIGVNFQNVVRLGVIVRRLTPLECEKLQGFPDGWTDIGDWNDSKGKTHKGDSDSPRYKALGNSIALPFWEWMAKRMVEVLKEEGVENPTMASLFDGIGGFPLAYSRAGCKPVWASEIEEFPIAVTKIRFPEDET